MREQTAAHRTISKFGGITAFATALQYPKSTVQRWSVSGRIHPKHNAVILNAAASNRIHLDRSDFVDVDVNHPAFNAPSISSSDNNSDHAAGSCIGPTPEIPESPRLAGGAVDRADDRAEASG